MTQPSVFLSPLKQSKGPFPFPLAGSEPLVGVSALSLASAQALRPSQQARDVCFWVPRLGEHLHASPGLPEHPKGLALPPRSRHEGNDSNTVSSVPFPVFFLRKGVILSPCKLHAMPTSPP